MRRSALRCAGYRRARGQAKADGGGITVFIKARANCALVFRRRALTTGRARHKIAANKFDKCAEDRALRGLNAGKLRVILAGTLNRVPTRQGRGEIALPS